jgi:hypothetical protein
MSDFKFECPHCSQHLQCDEQLSGRQILCPKCQHLIRIPPVPGKTVEYQAETGKTWATYVSPPRAAGSKPPEPPPAHGNGKTPGRPS